MCECWMRRIVYERWETAGGWSVRAVREREGGGNTHARANWYHETVYESEANRILLYIYKVELYSKQRWKWKEVEEDERGQEEGEPLQTQEMNIKRISRNAFPSYMAVASFHSDNRILITDGDGRTLHQVSADSVKTENEMGTQTTLPVKWTILVSFRQWVI